MVSSNLVFNFAFIYLSHQLRMDWTGSETELMLHTPHLLCLESPCLEKLSKRRMSYAP